MNKENISGYGPQITTYTGRLFKIMDPEPDFHIDDIAHALSNTCRYAGHCREFYSVAEHSVLVSNLVDELHLGDPFIGLMHDGHEAYFSDVPSPFKALLPDWIAIDVALEEKLYNYFNMTFPREPGIKEADVIAFFIEREHLFSPAGNLTYSAIQNPELKYKAEELMKQGWEIICWSPEDAEYHFMRVYERLQKQTRED